MSSFWQICTDLFEVLITLFESLMTKNGGYIPHEHEESHNNGNGDITDSKTVSVAFQFFGSSVDEAKTDPACAREKIKKSFRRMSRLHHPDRNGGSDEAVAKMQEINREYKCCCDYLDEIEGIIDEPEEDNCEPSETDYSPENDVKPHSRGCTKNGTGNTRGRRNGAAEAECEETRRNEAQRERELRREYKQKVEEVKRESSRLGRNQKKRQRPRKSTKKRYQPIPPSTVVNRAEELELNHRRWLHECAQQQREGRDVPTETARDMEHDIDDDRRGASHDGCPSILKKPSHPTLEQCSDLMAVAIRLGHSEVVCEMISDKMFEVAMRVRMLNQERRSMDDKLIHDSLVEMLLSPLDDDHNTVLHYVCYHEASEILSMILMMIGDDYDALVLQNNARGQIPSEFCQIANDPAFKACIDAATDAAKKKREDRKPSNRFRNMIKTVDPLQVIYTAFCVAVGRVLFGCGNVSSIALVCTATTFELDLINNHVQLLFELNIFWWWAKNLVWFVWRGLSWWIVVPLILMVLNFARCLYFCFQVSNLPVVAMRYVIDATGVSDRIARLPAPYQGLAMLCTYATIGLCFKLWALQPLGHFLHNVIDVVQWTAPNSTAHHHVPSEPMGPAMEKARKMFLDSIDEEL